MELSHICTPVRCSAQGMPRAAGQGMGWAMSSFHARRLELSGRAQFLRSMIEVSRHAPGEAASVLVFDLDGTLLDNRPRVVRIFQELAESWRLLRPKEALLLQAVKTNDVVYGLRENLTRAGITDPVLQAEGEEFWKQRFFQDAYLRYDVETEGAAAFVRACYAAGATIVYLTGRDLPNMALGTFASLRDLGFPIGVVGTSLVTKPAFEIPDAQFKHDVAPSLVRHGKIVASFDNEPANTNLFLEHHPLASAVFLDTHHAPTPPELDGRAVVIDSFEING